MLDIRHLTLTLGGRRLFDDIAWSVPGDAKMALVGRNGVGKTTLLRILAGEVAPDDVQVSWPPKVTWGYLPQEVERRGNDKVIDRVLGGAAHILALEAKVLAATRLLEQAEPGEAEARAVALSDAQAAYEQAEGPRLVPRAHEMLRGLGFTQAQSEGPLTALSGGWWMRVELARLLVGLPQYLFLDEPTNHLDQASTRWLASFLKRYRGAWVIVSHDRAFLNATVSSVAELTPQKMYVHLGNYDAFVRGRDARLADESAQRESYREKVAQNMAFVERFGAKASKATQAQSRLKAIERLEPPPAEAVQAESMRLRWPSFLRAGKTVLTATGLTHAFGARRILDAVELNIQRGDKIALLGPNGAGKSTLLNILAERFAPQQGDVTLGHQVAPYHFAQHQLETLKSGHTLLESLREQSPETSDEQLRRILGSFMFHGDSVFQPIGVLSGGEKSRVALARMMTCPVNFLLLDEPTNHLDVDSRAVLQRALEDFGGTLVVISHDEEFLEPIVNRVWECTGDGQVAQHAGGIAEYKARKSGAADAKRARESTENAGSGAAISSNKASFLANKEAQREAKKQRRELTQIEAKIAEVETRLQQIDASLADPKIFGDHAQAKELFDERRQLDEEALPELMARWEALAQAVH